jgi:hypothetical protein
LDKVADKLNQVTYRKVIKDVPWWGNELENLSKEVRENKKEDKIAFKRPLPYNKAIFRMKRKSFVKFSEEISETSTVAKIRKVLSKD